jgi:HlyD family secretion protein
MREHLRLGKLGTAVLAAVVGAASVPLLYAWSVFPDRDVKGRYQTALITRGDVVTTVTANGTVNPVGVISVGTQVSGTIERLYADYNDKVKAGQLLAQLDPAIYEADVRQSKANLSSASAALQLAQQKEERASVLLQRRLAAQQDLDQAIQQRVAAEAEVAVAQAQLSRDVSNLGYTQIFAPVAGIVLSREVALGQTVAASFQTPLLFKLAEDLDKMQIECNVPEADIGDIQISQRVVFSVEAFRGRTFSGRLRQVRFNPKVEQGIVNYTVIIDVENSDGKLMPGMTALVSIVTAERRNVLVVPSAAFDFRPGPNSANQAVGAGAPHLFVLDDGAMRTVPVSPGVSNAEITEVSGPALRVGTAVIVAETDQAAERGG